MAKEQEKRLVSARCTAWIIFLEEPPPTDLQDRCLSPNVFAQQRRLGERIKVSDEVLAASHNIIICGQLVPRSIRGDPLAPERSAVHPERTEETDVSPAMHVLTDAAALVNGAWQLESGRLQGGLQADRARAEDGDTGSFAARHVALLALPRRGGLLRHDPCVNDNAGPWAAESEQLGSPA
jgi:hypothetical protein